MGNSETSPKKDAAETNEPPSGGGDEQPIDEEDNNNNKLEEGAKDENVVDVAGARRQRRNDVDAGHALRSSVKGKSDIETLADSISDRRNNRIAVTFQERKHFLDLCYEVAKKEGGSANRFSKKGLQNLIDEYQERVSKKESVVTSGFYKVYNGFFNLLGYWDMDKSMLELFQAGMVYLEKGDEDEFYFRDFNFYSLKIKSRFSFLRVTQLAVFFWLLVYFLGSAVLFCPIMRYQDICDTSNSPYGGWLSSIYFAAVTMSTVGYGDLSLVDGLPWQVFIGILFMLVSMMMAFTVFSAAAEMTFGGVFGWDMLAWLDNNYSTTKEKPLYMQIRRMVWLRVVELTTYFIILNAVGVFVARAFVNNSSNPEEKWDWMTTAYWAVQTTTTIGYGDLNMPFQLRWFNIFFTTFGTAFVGGVFGSLANLKTEINDKRNYYAWRRREVSKHMIKELQINDDKLDQYEFMVASLLLLNKIDRTDVNQIMDKFRELAGERGYVYVEEIDEEAMDTAEEANGGINVPKGLLPV